MKYHHSLHAVRNLIIGDLVSSVIWEKRKNEFNRREGNRATN